MGPIPVVSERQFDGGEKLIRALLDSGVPLDGACWAKTPDYGNTYLYLVSPEVEGADARPTYKKVWAAVAQLDAAQAWSHWLERIDPSGVMLVGPGTDMGQALRWEYDHAVKQGPSIAHGWLGRSVSLEGAAYVYPPELFRPAAAAAGTTP